MISSKRGFTLTEIVISLSLTGFLMMLVANQLGFLKNIREGSMTTFTLEQNVRNLNRDLKFAFDRGRNLKTVVLDANGNTQPDPEDPTKLVTGLGAMIIESDLRSCIGTGANSFSPATSSLAANITRVVVVCCGDIVKKDTITVKDRNGHAMTIKSKCGKSGLVYAKFKPNSSDTVNTMTMKDCVPDFNTFVVSNEGFNAITNDTLYGIFLSAASRNAQGQTPFGGARVRNLEKFFSLANTGSGMSTLCREQLQ